MAAQPNRSSARTWLLAAVELLAAVAVTRLIVSGPAEPMDMGAPAAGVASWGRVEYIAMAAAATALVAWLVTRWVFAAVSAAAALTVLAASEPVRILATQSHLMAMVTLDVLLVFVPLLVLVGIPRPPDRTQYRGRALSVVAVATALAYAALLIAVHVPAVHRRAGGLAPLWLTVIGLFVGICFWWSVLHTGGRVPVRIRRAVLLGAQEVAAFIGLLSLFGAWAAMGHGSPLGVSTGWDQRLGGVFMIAACAAVAIPVLRGLAKQR